MRPNVVETRARAVLQRRLLLIAFTSIAGAGLAVNVVAQRGFWAVLGIFVASCALVALVWAILAAARADEDAVD